MNCILIWSRENNTALFEKERLKEVATNSVLHEKTKIKAEKRYVTLAASNSNLRISC